MTYTNLKYGSKGDEVKKLQETLISAGYDVGKAGADGILGKDTQAAIKQYQKDNGLTVDGIAGKITQGSLYGTAKPAVEAPKTPADVATASVEPTNTGNGANPGTTQGANPEVPAVEKPMIYGNLTDENAAAYNEVLAQAWDKLQQMQANPIGPYQYGDDYRIAGDYLSQYQNRDPFSYDFNSDALYNQYKDMYVQQGRMAMMDTMGQAAAMTGGYGNSYAQAVGQQAYNQQLNQLNDVMPELYQMALNRYTQEGQDLLNMYDIYMGRENDNYAKYLDSVQQYNDQVDMAMKNYQNIYDEYVGAYDQDYSETQTERQWDYQDKQDAKKYLIDLITTTGYEPTDAELKAAGISKAQAQSYKKAYENGIKVDNSGGSGGTGSKDDTKHTTPTHDDRARMKKEVAQVQTIAELKGLVAEYQEMGYSDSFIETITKAKAEELGLSDAFDTSVDPLNAGKLKRNLGVGGGGSGGTMYLEQW